MQLSRDYIERLLKQRGSTNINGGSSGGDTDLTGYAQQSWVDGNYVSKTYFSQIFDVVMTTRVVVKNGDTVVSDTTTTAALSPNDTKPENTIETDTETGYVTYTYYTLDVQVKAGVWTNSYLSALGQNSSGGGEGGASSLTDLLDVAISSPTNGQALVYNDTTGKWVNSTIQSGSSAWQDITGKPTTISGYGITDAYISNGTIHLGNSSITPLTGITLAMVTTALGYTPLSNATTFWGQQAQNGAVTGTLNSVNEINMSGALVGASTIFESGNYLLMKSGSRSLGLMIEGGVTDTEVTPNVTRASFGFHTASDSHSIAWNGAVALQLLQSTAETVVSVPEGILQIGDLRLVYDSTNNALKVTKIVNGSEVAANFYATGGVSSLGMSSGGSVSTLAVSSAIEMANNSTIKFTNQAGDAKMSALTVDTSNNLVLGEAWTSSGLNTYIRGYNVFIQTGTAHANTVTISDNGLQCSRFYLDSTRYLYVSSGTLYYYNGTTSKQISFTN